MYYFPHYFRKNEILLPVVCKTRAVDSSVVGTEEVISESWNSWKVITNKIKYIINHELANLLCIIFFRRKTMDLKLFTFIINGERLQQF